MSIRRSTSDITTYLREVCRDAASPHLTDIASIVNQVLPNLAM